MKALFLFFIFVFSTQSFATTCKEAKIEILVENLHLRMAEGSEHVSIERELIAIHDNWSSAYPELGRLSLKADRELDIEANFMDEANKSIYKKIFKIDKDKLSSNELRDFIKTATEKNSVGKIVFNVKEGNQVLCSQELSILITSDQ